MKKLIYHSIVILVLAAGAAWLPSCKDPLSINENTHVHIDDPKPMILPPDSLELFSVEGTDSDDSYRRTFKMDLTADPLSSLSPFECRLDTSKSIPRLTLRMSFVPTGEFLDTKTYAFQRLLFRVDSLPIDGDGIVNLNHGEISAVILAYKKVNNRIVEVMDTVRLTDFDQFNFAFLQQNIVSGKEIVRLTLNVQALSISQVDNKRRLARLQAVMKLRY